MTKVCRVDSMTKVCHIVTRDTLCLYQRHMRDTPTNQNWTVIYTLSSLIINYFHHLCMICYAPHIIFFFFFYFFWGQSISIEFWEIIFYLCQSHCAFQDTITSKMFFYCDCTQVFIVTAMTPSKPILFKNKANAAHNQQSPLPFPG